MTARTPDHEAMRAAASFDAIPPLPRSVARAPCGHGEDRVVGSHLADEAGRAVDAGVARVEPVGVGEQDQQVGGHQVRHERGHAVVVAVADLVDRDGVVLVDDRHAAQLQQPQQRLAGVQVRPPVHEAVRGEQHLGADRAVVGEEVVVDLHQPALARRAERLQGRHVVRTAVEADRRDSGGDRTRRHDDGAVAGVAQGHDLLAQLHDRTEIDDPGGVGQRRGADLGDDGGHGASTLLRRAGRTRVIGTLVQPGAGSDAARLGASCRP